MYAKRYISVFVACVVIISSVRAEIDGFVSLADTLTDPYSEIPLGDIKPKGWLLHQLEIMRDGSTGHLDQIHPKLKNDNGWLGGKGDGWEETPYWLDGAVPLAYLLDDPQLKTKVLRYIEWTLKNQRPSGYFGPITKEEREKGLKVTADNCAAGEDWWPKMIMLKVLQQHYMATSDERVINFMTKYFNYQLKTLKQCPLGKWTEWAASRGAENVMMAQWLYGITKQKSLIELASLIESQSFEWSTWLGNRDWVMNAAANQTDKDWMRRHAVNLGMALKSPAINYQRTGDKKYLGKLKTGWNDLMALHGLPMGIFSGDEDIHGNDPTQGVELCAIVEAMYSLEKISQITKDVQYMDALEKMTFNALPTQTTDDYNMKQYFQIANQVQVSRGVFDFSLPFDRGMNNVFGLRSGYTCCTSNMHQGWTKFAARLWYSTNDGGLAALQYSPNELHTKAKGKDVIIREITNFPFDETVNFEFSTKDSVKFALTLRIPSWCKNATVSVNGEKLAPMEAGHIITIESTWKNGDKVILNLPMDLKTSNWGKNSRAIERGPLVYALKLEERWEKGNEPTEGDYMSVYPTQPWNYGILKDVVDNPSATLKVETRPVGDKFVWNIHNAPIEITAPVRKIPNWKAVDGVAHQPVTDRTGIYKGEVSDVVEKIKLIPYGCSKVRIVAFPVVK
jgi:DUF1680 family protein